MAQNHNADFTEKPMTTYGRTQSPSRRYRRLRHPTFPAAEWASKNPLLQRGEIGVESDTHKVKVGDGLTYWNSLQYVAADAEGQQKSTADYSMGNSSGGWTVMSTAQQNALNSGATTTNITQIGTNTTSIGNHIADTANPHQVTAAQVGLGNADNTSDADKPISTATQSALDGKQAVASADYQMGNVSGGWTTMSSAQQDALNSGATTTNIGAIANKVDKTSTAKQVYATDDNGDQTTLGYSQTATAYTVAQRISSGRLLVGTPTSDSHATTKKYVDDALSGKQDTLTAGTNINITGSTISATDTTYTGSDGVTLTGTNFTNSGVRSVSSGTANGTISVNTNGTSADVSVTGLGSAAYTASSDYATSAQGGKADTAVQPGDLATVATTGLYSDLTGTPSLAAVATSGAYSDLTGTPTIPAAQVNSDWDANSGVAEILNKPTTLAGYGITDAVQTGHELVAFQEPTVENNYTWYRKYKDGWVEQGGWVASTSTSEYGVAVSLPVEMANNRYLIQKTYDRGANSTGGNNWLWLSTSVSSVTNTTTTLHISVPSNTYVLGAFWEVKGMAA